MKIYTDMVFSLYSDRKQLNFNFYFSSKEHDSKVSRVIKWTQATVISIHKQWILRRYQKLTFML